MKAICPNCKTVRQYDRERAGETVPCTICGALLTLVQSPTIFTPPAASKLANPYAISITSDNLRPFSPLPTLGEKSQQVIISGINLSFKDLLRLYWFFTLAQALVLLPFAILALLIYAATR